MQGKAGSVSLHLPSYKPSSNGTVPHLHRPASLWEGSADDFSHHTATIPPVFVYPFLSLIHSSPAARALTRTDTEAALKASTVPQ